MEYIYGASKTRTKGHTMNPTTRNEIICSALDIAQRATEAAAHGYKLPADLLDMVDAHRALLLTVAADFGVPA